MGGWGDGEGGKARSIAVYTHTYTHIRTHHHQQPTNTRQLAAFNRLTSLLLQRADEALAAVSPSSPPPSLPPPPTLLTPPEASALAALFPPHDGTKHIEAFTRLLLTGGPPVVAGVRAMGGHCACLPAHASEWPVVEGMVQATAALVGRLCRGTCTRRSVDEWGWIGLGDGRGRMDGRACCTPI
jgi:hypothetical protein